MRRREFFEQVIRDTRSVDLGQPDRVQLIFGRWVYRNTPSRFRGQVVHAAVQPNLYLTDKHSGVKQYFKLNRALRTETTINSPGDLSYLRDIETGSQYVRL